MNLFQVHGFAYMYQPSIATHLKIQSQKFSYLDSLK